MDKFSSSTKSVQRIFLTQKLHFFVGNLKFRKILPSSYQRALPMKPTLVMPILILNKMLPQVPEIRSLDNGVREEDFEF